MVLMFRKRQKTTSRNFPFEAPTTCSLKGTCSVFMRLFKSKGWSVPGETEIVKMTLPDGDFLVAHATLGGRSQVHSQICRETS